MDELLVTAPEAHQHLAQIHPELQEPAADSLLNLAHLALIKSDVGIWDETYTRIPQEEHSPEQKAHNERVVTLINESARLTSMAAAGVENDPSLADVPAYLRHNEILNRAKFIALDEAKRHKADGNNAGAEKALQNMLAIGLVQQAENRNQKEIRETVASGLEKQLLAAIQGMDGIVHSANSFTPPESVTAMLAPSADLLRVASKADFDDNFQNPENHSSSSNPQIWQEKLENLDYASLCALARNEKQHFPESAARLAVTALNILADEKKTYRCDAEEAADTIMYAAEYVQQAGDNPALEREHQKALHGLRARREAGTKYRINHDITYGLDDAMILLVHRGRNTEAQALLSSSPREIPPDGSAPEDAYRYNLGSHIARTPYLTEEEKATVTNNIRVLHSENVEHFRASLSENGASQQTIDTIHMLSADPDSALGINPKFWETYSTASKHFALRDMIEGTQTSQLAATADTISQILDTGLDPEYVDGHLARCLSKVEGQSEKNNYLREIAEIVADINERTRDPNRPWERGDLALQAFSEFASPKQALDLATRVFGDKAISDAYSFQNMLRDSYGPRETLIEISADAQAVLEYTAEHASSSNKLTDANLLKNYLIPAGIETVQEAVTTIENSAGLQEFADYAGSANLWSYMLDESSVTDRLAKLAEAYESAEVKDVFNSFDDNLAMRQALARSLLANGTPQTNAEQIVKLHQGTSFLREAGVHIDYTGHTEEWELFIRSIPDGNAGAIMRKQIIARLQLGIGEDPTQAIRIFTEIKVSDTQLRALNSKGINLIRKLIGAESEKGFPSPKPSKIGEYFYDEKLANLYKELHALKMAGDMEGVANFIQAYGLEPDHDLTRENLRDLIVGLKQDTADVNKDIRTAQFWLKEYSGQNIKAAKLIEAWDARQLALENGVKDNPTDILHFAAEHGLEIYAEKIFASGLAPITKEEFEEQKGWLKTAIGSRYAPKTVFGAIQHLADYKREHGTFPDKILGANKTTITAGENEYTAEIFAKDDPRGFTIGVDTGCCMTLGGASETCIWAGYEDARYSFFGVYDSRGKLRAQSLLYIAESDDKKILVIDNIEANAGTDLGPIAEVYRSSLQTFIGEQGLGIDEIHVGIGFTPGEIIKNLPDTPTNPQTPKHGVYSDAGLQKLLWSKN